MYLPFMIKDRNKELVACGLTVKGDIDDVTGPQLLSMLGYLIQKQLGKQVPAEGPNDAKQGA